jgi:polysaccharide biosynthesis transport protein
MELVQYIRLVRRWLWLLILAGFIGGSVSFISRVSQAQLYRAQTLIQIGGFIQAQNPNQSEIYTGIALTETYAQLVRTQNVLDATVTALDAPLDPDDLDGLLETRILPSTALLQLSITYTDPILTADLANELAQQLILASPSNLTPEQLAQVDLLNEQITSLTQEITDLRATVSTLDLQLSADNLTDTQRTEFESERITLVEQINQASSNIAQFTNTVASLQERTNSVEIVETARIPESSLGRNTISSTILGAITAGALAFGLVLLFEYLNDTFHNAEEVTQTLKIPMLGVISRHGKKSGPYRDKLLINNLTSRVPDEFRILRTNLLFSNERTNGIYLISSALPSEGKSITTANLAISMALSGLRVLLIDGDLRRPRVHEILGLDNTHGLTSLLTIVPSQTSDTPNLDDTDPHEVSSLQAQAERIQGSPQQVYSPDTWRQVVQATNVDNLKVITAGHSVENPTELLGSALMKRWMQIINNKRYFDIILIDTPPSLGFPDATVVSVSLDSKVLLVIEAGRTRRESAMRMVQRFTQVNADIIGVVLNQTNPREESYYGYDYYYNYYRTEAQQSTPPQNQNT